VHAAEPTKKMNHTFLLAFTLLALAGPMLPLPGFAQADATDSWQALVKREFGTATNALAAIEKEIQAARPEQYPAIEAKLIAVLETPGATMPGRQFACQMLKLVGSSKCVPAMSKLLTDDQLSHMARSVLAGLHGPAVDDALQKALASTRGNLCIGVINSLGDRRDTGALKALERFLGANDDATVQAAFNATGRIGGMQGADVLDRAKASAGGKDYWANAYLTCAGSLAAAGEAKRAMKMYQTLYDGNFPAVVRAAAFPALVKEQKEKAVPQILKLLDSDNLVLQKAAVSAVISVPGTAATKALVQSLAALTPETQVVLLGALASRGDAGPVTESANNLAASANQDVRLTALKALARLGNNSSVTVLATALKDVDPIAKAATSSLVELQAEGVTEALMKQATAGDLVVRQAVLNVLSQRGKPEALPAVRQAVNDDDPAIRQAGLKALTILGTQEDIARLAAILPARKDNSEQEQIAETMSAIAGRLKDKTSSCDPVLEVLSKADPQAKVNLLTVLAVLGGDAALKATRDCLNGEAEVRKAAIRTLAEWSDSSPTPDLLTIARNDKDQTSQILALRGYIRMLGISSESAAAKTESYRDAMSMATRPDEKKLVLNGISKVAHVDALKLVGSCLENPGLKQEAFVAYEKIAESLTAQDPAAAKEALQRVADGAGDNGLSNRAKRALERMKK
jgi:HEAT repeat protein